tara:strand:+ start:141 stop:323 length:183 start_codon:yes stop_codon:yes gene_type:complete
MNPLKEVKQEKNPLKIIFSLWEFNLFATTTPNKNEPIIETKKLLLIHTLRKVAAKQDNRI